MLEISDIAQEKLSGHMRSMASDKAIRITAQRSG